MTTEDGTAVRGRGPGPGTDRAAKARAARSRLALERRADYLRERGWTCTPPGVVVAVVEFCTWCPEPTQPLIAHHPDGGPDHRPPATTDEGARS
jgi:hypothetical protein